jgi:hypothetical protein
MGSEDDDDEEQGSDDAAGEECVDLKAGRRGMLLVDHCC